MRINNLLPQNNQTKPSFKGVDYFQQIKAIPGINCGCCGKETLFTDMFIKTVTPLAKPLSVQIESGVLRYLEKKFPKAWETIKSFTEKFPSESLDNIIHSVDNKSNEFYVALKKAVVEDIDSNDEYKNLEKIERERFVGKTFYDLTDWGRSHMQNSSTVMKAIMPLKNFLTGTKKEVFEQFEIYSRRFPDKTLSEIAVEPKIAEFHSTKNLLQRMETREKLDYHFENILIMVEKQNPKAVEEFKELKEKVLEMSYTENDPKRREFLAKKMYIEALRKNNCDSLEEKVLKELEQLPKTFMTKDSFFKLIVSKKLTDGQIINLLFSHILASEEHVLPIHNGGKDVTGNKIVMCRECNSKRKSIPYKEFIKYHSEMPDNIQKQLNLVAENILVGNISDKLRQYPINVVENLNITSEGEIKPNISEYCEKVLTQSEEKVAKNTNNITQLNGDIEKIETQINWLTRSNDEEAALQQDIKEYLEKNK